MGKTVALRVTHGERRAFFKRRGQDLRFTLAEPASTGEHRRGVRPTTPHAPRGTAPRRTRARRLRGGVLAARPGAR
jgi:hypothetical protein